MDVSILLLFRSLHILQTFVTFLNYYGLSASRKGKYQVDFEVYSCLWILYKMMVIKKSTKGKDCFLFLVHGHLRIFLGADMKKIWSA